MFNSRKLKIIISCEHGGNQIPEDLKKILKIPEAVLNSHEGLDIGALDLAKYLADYFDLDDFFYAETSRLVIELNRSEHHPKLFSRFSKKYLTQDNKINLISNFYRPYRSNIENIIFNLIKQNYLIIHLSVHSFTPVLNHKIRDLDIGLLYDPRNKYEQDFCKVWQKELEKLNFKTRRNYPYQGASDGLTSYLRKIFKNNYLGIELETNQDLWQEKNIENKIKNREKISESLAKTVALSLTALPFDLSHRRGKRNQ